MKALIVYDSSSGSTHRIAQTIAAQLVGYGEVEMFPAAEMYDLQIDSEGTDLLIIGCPTKRHHPTPEIAHLLESLTHNSLLHKEIAVFDIRTHGTRWFNGTLACQLAKRLKKLGGHLLIPAESFLVSGNHRLSLQDLDRAERWGSLLAQTYEGYYLVEEKVQSESGF